MITILYINMIKPVFNLELNKGLGILKLEDNAKNVLAKARFIEKDEYIYVGELKSYEKNKGYGSLIIDYIKTKFAGKTISLSASWIDKKPPHKFYIDKGFIPKDKQVFEKLKEWIKNGAKVEEFPLPRCNSACQMTLDT